jgi:hypothetical protein
MPRPITHGARWLAARLEANRLEPRVRRMLGKLQRALAADTWKTVAGLAQGRIARRELLMQQREAHLLADPNAEGGKWLLGMWAAQRRDLELLALLEKQRADEHPDTTCARCNRAFPADGYLNHRCEPTP